MKRLLYLLVMIMPLSILIAAVGPAVSAEIFSEGFESYAPGSYPSPPWLNMFSGISGTVSTEEAYTGSQSFRSESYSNWARWDYVVLSTMPDKMIYRGAVYLTESFKGAFIGFGYMQPGTSNTGRATNTFHFNNNGDIAFETKTAGFVILGTWSPGRWYEVEARLDYNTLQAELYIDGALVDDEAGIDPKAFVDPYSGVTVNIDKFGMFADNFNPSYGYSSVNFFDDLSVFTAEARLDIKPGSCPNPLSVKFLDGMDNGKEVPNMKSKKGGVIPAALVGSAYFDVTGIDVSTILLEGIAPLRYDLEDVTAPAEGPGDCPCTMAGPDGFMDLSLKFSRLAVATAIGSAASGDVIELTITGEMNNGAPFEATDCVTIVGKQPDLFMVAGGETAELGVAVPNPFNPNTAISFYLPKAGVVTFEIFDSEGRLVRRLIDAETRPAGISSVEWRGVNETGAKVDSGVYFYRIKAGDVILSRKMILMR